MKSRLLIIFTIGIIGFTGISFAEESPGSPIPKPEQESFTYTNCGPGTIYQDGICVVDETENSNQTKNQNEKWPAAYQDISKDSEPEPPTISDEQERMMREYCETGIRHQDMIGIPQCIKNELVCGPGAELVDGICMVTPRHPVGSDASLLPFVGGLVLVFGIIGLVGYYIWRKRK